MPSDRPIQFECPKCLGQVTAPLELAGGRIECPDCGASLNVPSHSPSSQFDDLFVDDLVTETPPAETVTDPPLEPVSNPKTPGPTPNATPAFDDLDVDSLKPVEAVKPPVPKIQLDEEPEANTKNNNDDDDILELEDVAPIVVQSEDEVAEDAGNQLLAGLGDELKIGFDDGPIEMGKDPFEVDESAPLKIDGLTDDIEEPELVVIRCRICDTRIHANRKQIGSTVECPDCYSKIEVTEPRKLGAKNIWEQPQQAPSESTKRSADNDKRNRNESAQRPKPEMNIEEDFGLAPIDDDMLAPVESPKSDAIKVAEDLNPIEVTDELERIEDQPEAAPDEEQNETDPLFGDGELKLSPIDEDLQLPSSPMLPNYLTNPPKKILDDSAQDEQQVNPGSDFVGQSPNIASQQQQTKPSPEPPRRSAKQHTPRQGSPTSESATAGKRSQTRQTTSQSSKAEAPADETGAVGPESILPVNVASVQKYLTEAFSSIHLPLRLSIVLIMFTVSYSFLDWFWADWFKESGIDLTEAIYAVVQAVIGGVLWLGGAMMLAIIFAFIFRDAADGKSDAENWPGLGVSEWFGSFAFVAFSFWVASLPGVIMGNILSAIPGGGGIIWVLMLTPISVFLLMPILIVCALFNDSVFNIIAPEVFKSFNRQRDSWICLYQVIGICLGVYLLGTMILFIPFLGVLFNAIGAAIQLLAVASLAVACGLQASRIINEINERG